ncbi:MAG: peroxiredoxin-like family protein [Alcanivorax sp.]
MRFIIPVLALSFFFSAPALSEGTVTEKLEQRKKDFGSKAEPQKRKDYDEGVEFVRQAGVVGRAKSVGDTAPDFTLKSAAGDDVTLSNLLKTGPVVMIWYRGEWCPYCNIHLEDVQAHLGEFKEAGAHIVAISPETPDHGWTLQDKKSIEYYVLSDLGSAVAKEYGVAYTLPPKIAEYYQDGFGLHEKNNDDSNILPIAASYVIGQDGKITYAFLDADYRKRAETSVLLSEVQKLKRAQ